MSFFESDGNLLYSTVKSNVRAILAVIRMQFMVTDKLVANKTVHNLRFDFVYILRKLLKRKVRDVCPSQIDDYIEQLCLFSGRGESVKSLLSTVSMSDHGLSGDISCQLYILYKTYDDSYHIAPCGNMASCKLNL